MQKAKELPPSVIENSHWNDPNMIRRLKEYRAKNPESGNVKDYFIHIIGHSNVLEINVMLPEKEKLSKMMEIIE